MEIGRTFKVGEKLYISCGVEHCAGCVAQDDSALCRSLDCGDQHDCDCVIYKEITKE